MVASNERRGFLLDASHPPESVRCKEGDPTAREG
jgi:hypothetical protein